MGRSSPIAAWSDFWADSGHAVETLVLHAAGILAYAVVVHFFCQISSRRAMSGAKPAAAKPAGPSGGFAYLAFPLHSFGFFLLLSLPLIFLGGQRQAPGSTFTLVLAVVLAVRVAAYRNESLSRDVARILPIGVLGAVLVNAQFTTLRSSWQNLGAIDDHAELVILFFAIVVALEYAMYSAYLIAQGVRSRRPPPRPPRPPRPSGAHGAEPRQRPPG